MRTFEMLALADKDGKTYKSGTFRYNKSKGFYEDESYGFSSLDLEDLQYFMYRGDWESYKKIITIEDIKNEFGEDIEIEGLVKPSVMHPMEEIPNSSECVVLFSEIDGAQSVFLGYYNGFQWRFWNDTINGWESIAETDNAKEENFACWMYIPENEYWSNF